MAKVDSVIRDLTAFSDAHIQRFTGLGSNEARWMLRDSTDHIYVYDDFTGVSINTVAWTTNNGGGASAASMAVAAASGGTVAGATGTANGATASLNFYGPAIWSGAKNCFLEAKLKFSTVAAVQWEMGFIDTISNITAPQTSGAVVTDVDTPTFGAGVGDACIVAQDLSQTFLKPMLATLGSGALNTGSKDNFGASITIPTLATYFTLRVGLVGTTAIASLNRSAQSTLNVKRVSATASATLLRPYFFCKATSAVSIVPTLDYVLVLGDR